MSATLSTNGKPQRKQLADQLDRLDGIIDALAEGLNQAVADAAREGTRMAVKDAIIEIMTNPELRALLVPHVLAPAPAPKAPDVPPEPKKPGIWARIKAKVAAAKGAVVACATKVKAAVAAKCAPVAATVTAVAAVGGAAGAVLPVRRVLGVALGAGVLVALVCSQMPESVSAVVAGVGVAVSAACAQIGAWLHRVARRVGLLS